MTEVEDGHETLIVHGYREEADCGHTECVIVVHGLSDDLCEKFTELMIEAATELAKQMIEGEGGVLGHVTKVDAEDNIIETDKSKLN